MKNFILLLALIIGSTGFCQDINKKDAQGRKQGVWKKPHEGVQQYKYVGQFKDDKPVGKFVYFRTSGTVEAILQFQDNGSVAYSQMYHESGYMMARGKYVNQKKDSTWVYYDDRGIVSYQEDYKNGLLDGQKVIYYEPKDGEYKVKEYSYWKEGVQHGEYKKYHPNKNVAEEGVYTDGNFDGTIKLYHPNGRIKSLQPYQFAVKHGFWIFYNEKGVREGYVLYWEGKKLKGQAKLDKEAELKANGTAPPFVP